VVSVTGLPTRLTLHGETIMATAFTGSYTDQSLTTRAPFTPQSLPAPVTNPRDLGENRTYRNDLADSARQVDLSAQQADSKPFPPNKWEPGYDPYANGGGLEAYLDNSGG
jgi:hypothetical protein